MKKKSKVPPMSAKNACAVLGIKNVKGIASHVLASVARDRAAAFRTTTRLLLASTGVDTPRAWRSVVCAALKAMAPKRKSKSKKAK